MAASTYRPRSAQDETPLRRRVSGLALAVAIEILLLLALLTLDFTPEPKPEFKGGGLTTFDIAADKKTAAKPAQRPADAGKQPLRPVAPEPRRPLPERPLAMIIVSKEVFAASDISRLGRNAPDAGAELTQGSAPGDSDMVGTGPNGAPLYAAEWYRKPTDQELSAYLPPRIPGGGGWGMIACRTIERYRVTDCVELGNEPPGSRLAGAVRQAAWQFLVRPPRIGGRPLVGEWVRIRIDYLPERSAVRERTGS